MAAKKKSKSGRRTGRGKGANDIRRGPTRDPGPTGSVGCYFVLVSMLVIGLVIVLLEVFG
ncbi:MULTISPECIES: hypothetical protein [Nocardiopsis]|uniref:Uncharacterized protein n=1 Tax=Nocardiopsis sinuspersici TaxID=501010 RepID=A0A1V3C0V9_9ACTN|nr:MULTISPECIES: hypothetical protein [Nocardiopsis]NYH55798.1 hypothetical protein [Nocardiopsis sinuspersici]OOC54318.1 hypothetical protein NOSIN_11300 [Nocardiopsis sinuspersici]